MTSAFAPLGLSEKICETIARLGFEEPTPIQSAAVPELIKGGDVLGQAATGTGKTAAFALPAVEVFSGTEAKPGSPRVLVLTPTRELCLQVCESFVNFGQETGLITCPIYGGQDYTRQIRLLKRGVHVVVATPGRALDHLHRGTLDLSQVQFFVMDEADEMLDMGFADELEELTAALPQQHQTALFSATLPERILEIANKHLRNPKHIVIEKNTSEETPRVPQVAYVVSRPHRLAALARILEVEEAPLAICFARTRVEVDEVTEAMRARGFAVEALHGGLDQASRDRVMKRAKNGSIELIVATDVAARGIDLENLSHVVNLGLPASPETYVHRIGRTGRAGRTGTAISVIEPREHRRLRFLESHTKTKIEVRTVPTLTDARAKRLSALKNALAEELTNTEELERCRVVVEALCSEFDPMEVACAAVALANKAVHGDGTEEEIPAATPFERPKREKNRPHRLTEAPEAGMSRIYISTGHKAGVRPGDIVGAIANEAGIPSRKIGAIEITESFTLVVVEQSVAAAVIDSLGESTIKGRRVTVRFDRAPKRFEDDARGNVGNTHTQAKDKRKSWHKDDRSQKRDGRFKDKKNRFSDTSRFYE